MHCLLVGIALNLSGCSMLLRDTPTPIPFKTATSSPTASGRTLVVFLPGRGGAIEDFEKHGMTAVLRDAGVDADTVAVDAHLNYYYRRTVIERLKADVIEPARQRGYSRIVMVGVSLGGLGSLLYERDHPGQIETIVLIAPYLGDKDRLFENIVASGGPAAWAAGREARNGGVEEQLWTFLGSRSLALPSTWLLAGRDDRLSQGHRLLATILPSERVHFIAGGHDWRTWQALWREVCRNSPLFAAEKSMATTKPAESHGGNDQP
jgi:pimeloyl-ACP methyl ester carboxylesterase